MPCQRPPRRRSVPQRHPSKYCVRQCQRAVDPPDRWTPAAGRKNGMTTYPEGFPVPCYKWASHCGLSVFSPYPLIARCIFHSSHQEQERSETHISSISQLTSFRTDGCPTGHGGSHIGFTSDPAALMLAMWPPPVKTVNSRCALRKITAGNARKVPARMLLAIASNAPRKRRAEGKKKDADGAEEEDFSCFRVVGRLLLGSSAPPSSVHERLRGSGAPVAPCVR